MRVELPTGWADVRSRKEVTEKVWRRIERAETKTLHITLSFADRGYVGPEKWPKELQGSTIEMVDDVLKRVWPDSPDEAEALRRSDEIERRTRQNSLVITGITDEEDAVFDDYQNELILGMTVAWSYGPNITIAAIEDLPRDDCEALAAACKKEFKGTDVDMDPDPNRKAPTDA